MKIIFIAISACLILFTACNRKAMPSQTPLSNQLTKDSKGTPMLLGHCAATSFRQAPFNKWYDSAYTAYQPQSSSVATLERELANTTIEIFLGTWCGDSRREVPRLLKTLSESGLDTNNIHLILVDHEGSGYKQSPQHEEKGKYIFRVPTAIVYQNNKEVGRVIESPIQSWEQDLSNIATHQPYTPHYAAADTWIHQVSKHSIGDEEMKNLVAAYQPKLSSSALLNNVGYLLLGQKQSRAALQTFTFNTLLFPTDANVWDSLAEYYATIGNTSEALTYYKKVLSLKPGDANATAKIAELSKKGKG